MTTLTIFDDSELAGDVTCAVPLTTSGANPCIFFGVDHIKLRLNGHTLTGWGAPRIHREPLQLGFDISEPTVSRYLQRLKPRTDRKKVKVKRCLAFLQNHREIIAAFDFFTVPTLTFRVLYCFFVIEHHRRRILHFNVTTHPTSDWIVQQLREAFPLPCPYRYVVFDRDRKFAGDVRGFLRWAVFRTIGRGATQLSHSPPTFVVFLVWKRFSHPDGLINGLYDFFVIRVGQVC